MNKEQRERRGKYLLEEARAFKVGKNEPGYRDDKQFLSDPDDIKNLISAGAEELFINREDTLHPFFHKVRLDGHVFVCSSSYPIRFKPNDEYRAGKKKFLQ